MNFTSQICTTEEQSERLLALGLKRETADMYYPNGIQDSEHIIRAVYPAFWESDRKMDAFIRGRVIPAWSLHRLIEMCPLIPNPLRFLAVTSFKTVYVRMNDEMDVCYVGKGTYNNLIDCIEWLIKEGYFNKEYLEK